MFHVRQLPVNRHAGPIKKPRIWNGIALRGTYETTRSSISARDGHPDGQHQLFPRAQLPVDVGKSRFEDITDWLPRAAVELN